MRAYDNLKGSLKESLKGSSKESCEDVQDIMLRMVSKEFLQFSKEGKQAS